MANLSRKSPYFDLWVLLRDDDLDPAQLRRAIEATLLRRQTPSLANVPVGLTDVFAADAGKQTQWRAFLKKNKLEPIEFNNVIRMLRDTFQRIGVI